MTSHQSEAKIGIIKSSNGRTSPSYAVLERLSSGRYATYLLHHDVGGATRVAQHETFREAEARFAKLEIATALRR